MTIEKCYPSGAWRVTGMIGEYLESRVYFGYTKRKALEIFKREFSNGLPA